MGSLPVEIKSMISVVEYMFKVQMHLPNRFPRILYDTSNLKTKQKQNFKFRMDARYEEMVWKMKYGWHISFMMHQQIAMWMQLFYNGNVPWHGKNVEAHALNTTYVL